MYLLKHIALRSAVVKGTSGGYRISISGLQTQYITLRRHGIRITYPISTLKLQTMLLM